MANFNKVFLMGNLIPQIRRQLLILVWRQIVDGQARMEHSAMKHVLLIAGHLAGWLRI